MDANTVYIDSINNGPRLFILIGLDLVEWNKIYGYVKLVLENFSAADFNVHNVLLLTLECVHLSLLLCAIQPTI